jgi:hypothetical protein
MFRTKVIVFEIVRDLRGRMDCLWRVGSLLQVRCVKVEVTLVSVVVIGILTHVETIVPSQ